MAPHSQCRQSADLADWMRVTWPTPIPTHRSRRRRRPSRPPCPTLQQPLPQGGRPRLWRRPGAWGGAPAAPGASAAVAQGTPPVRRQRGRGCSPNRCPAGPCRPVPGPHRRQQRRRRAPGPPCPGQAFRHPGSRTLLGLHQLQRRHPKDEARWCPAPGLPYAAGPATWPPKRRPWRHRRCASGWPPGPSGRPARISPQHPTSSSWPHPPSASSRPPPRGASSREPPSSPSPPSSSSSSPPSPFPARPPLRTPSLASPGDSDAMPLLHGAADPRPPFFFAQMPPAPSSVRTR
mmetsp:Transcript_155221/g.497869  ORF Transcript_155221/g.497869 Transcript_155221/m.497869 type:complete len:291 (+) Transcript_155221:61-933(+)